MKLRGTGVISLIIALVFTLTLSGSPGPAMGISMKQPPAKEPVPQQGSVKSYGAGQVLLTADIDLPECWHRWTGASTLDAWWTCDEYWDRKTPAKTADYVTQRVVSYKEFTVPAEGALLMDVRLETDATHNGWLRYDIQRYDDSSAKWDGAGAYWQTTVRIENGKQTMATNTQYDLNLLSQDKDGKPWHPELKNFPLYPPGKYRLVASEEVRGALEWYAPGKGTFTIVFIPNGKPVSVDSDGDGVPDDKDQCSNTKGGTAVDEKGCPEKPSESTQPVLKVATVSSSKSIDMKNGLEFKFSEPGAISFPDGQMIVSPNGGTQVTVTDFINTDQEFAYESRIDANGEPFNILVPKDPEWINWQAFAFTAIPALGDSVIYRDEMGKINMIAKGEYLPQQGYQCVLVPAGPPKPPEPIYLHSPTRKQYLGNLAGPAIGRKIRENMEDPWTFIKMGGGMAVNYYAGPGAWVAYQIGIRVAPCILGDMPPASGSGINTALHFTPNEYVMMESTGYLLTLEKNAYFVLVQEGLVTRINDNTGQSLDIPGGYAALFCPGTETIPVKIEDLNGAPLTSCEDFYAAVKGANKNGSFTGTGTELIAESRTATPNSTIQVPIRLNNASNIGSMNFVVTYSPQVLRVNKVDSGSLLSGALFTPNYQSPPEVRCGLATSGGVSGSGTMAYIEFQVIGTAGSSSPLTISELSTGDASGQSITVNSQNGTVTVATSKLKGDYNGDGKLSEVDALAALRMSVKLLAQDLTLDMNGDGKLTAEDARLILKKALGK